MIYNNNMCKVMEDTQKYFLLHSSKPLHYCKITNTKTFNTSNFKPFLRHYIDPYTNVVNES